MSKAEKGSKFRMQQITSNPRIKSIIDDDLSKLLDKKEVLNWKSPLKKDNNYSEHRLNSKESIKLLFGNVQEASESFKTFWPQQSPVWDGIAVSNERDLFLFEGKSHKSETRTSTKAHNGEHLINQSLSMVASKFGVTYPNVKKNWEGKYYQLANRIAFAWKMKEMLSITSAKYNNVYMIFLNFMNDSTMDVHDLFLSSKDCQIHYETILKEMELSINTLTENNIFFLNIDVSNWK